MGFGLRKEDSPMKIYLILIFSLVLPLQASEICLLSDRLMSNAKSRDVLGYLKVDFPKLSSEVNHLELEMFQEWRENSLRMAQAIRDHGLQYRFFTWKGTGTQSNDPWSLVSRQLLRFGRFNDQFPSRISTVRNDTVLELSCMEGDASDHFTLDRSQSLPDEFEEEDGTIYQNRAVLRERVVISSFKKALPFKSLPANQRHVISSLNWDFQHVVEKLQEYEILKEAGFQWSGRVLPYSDLTFISDYGLRAHREAYLHTIEDCYEIWRRPVSGMGGPWKQVGDRILRYDRLGKIVTTMLEIYYGQVARLRKSPR